MIETVSYSDKYIKVSRNDLVVNLKKNVSDFRFRHILSVEKTALQLAKQEAYPDFEKVSIAAVMHDYCKDMSSEKMLRLAYDYTEDESLIKASTAIWHAYASAQYGKIHFGIVNQEILDAISQHTIGAKEMTLLSKIIFVADYIEPLRTFKKIDKARMKAEQSIDHAVFYKMRQSIKSLAKNSEVIYGESVENYNYWVKKWKES